MSIKFLVFFGGGGILGWGGGSADLIFMGAGIFLTVRHPNKGGCKHLAWLPLQSLAVKKKNIFFVQILGGEKLL